MKTRAILTAVIALLSLLTLGAANQALAPRHLGLGNPRFRIPQGRPKADPRAFDATTSLRKIAAGSKNGSVASPGSRKDFRDGTVELMRQRDESGGQLRPEATQNTIPYWSDSFSYQGLEFKYKMVGADPKKGSTTTVIPTVIIPLRFVFPDGQVFDASTDLVDGQTAIQGIINSPIFQPYDFTIGGTDVGRTQYGDAFQRANFWDSVSTRAPNYHVLLGQPTVLPTQTIVVPDGLGSYYHASDGEVFPVVDLRFLIAQGSAIRAALGVSLQSLPITVWGSVFGESGGFPTFASHGVSAANGGLLTWIDTSYTKHSDNDARTDVYSLSHEVVEWMDDPFIDNFSPGWNFPFLEPVERCDSGFVSGLLETADPVEFFPESAVALTGPNFTYHVTEAMFIDFYTRSPQSRSVNGQYSLFEIGLPFGLPTLPSSGCVGTVQAGQLYIDVPGSVFTSAQGLNNRGEVVGYYADQQNHIRGFIWKYGSFGAIDMPGALGTIPESINDAGYVVGFFYDVAGRQRGFSYANGQFAVVDFPGAVNTVLFGVNSAGEIVGGYDDALLVTHGFKLSKGAFTTIDSSFAQQTYLQGINDPGSYIGVASNDFVNGPALGLINVAGKFSTISMPLAKYTNPVALNNRGTIVGWFEDEGIDPYGSGFIRLFGFLHEVNAHGVQTYVYGINDDNLICGTAFDFRTRRWVGYVGRLPLKNPGGA